MRMEFRREDVWNNTDFPDTIVGNNSYVRVCIHVYNSELRTIVNFGRTGTGTTTATG